MWFPVVSQEAGNSQGTNEAWKSGKALSMLALESYTMELGKDTLGLCLCCPWIENQGILTN